MNTKYIHIGKSTILWEKTSFSRAFKFLKNNSLSRAELSDDNGNVKNIHYGDILIKFSECLYADEGNSIPYIINDNIAYKLLKLSPLINGDIVFADAAEDNTVGKCIEIITHNDTDLVAGLHTIPCRPTIKFAEGYLGYYLNSSAFHNQLLQYIQGTKISSISKKSICQTIISYPSEIINQQKIASYFQSLDSLIQSTSKKLVSLKQIKAASLQSMFPQEGETVPKVRFKGFEGEWEEKSFSALYKKSIIKNDLTFGTDKIISVANMYYLTNVNVSDLEYLKTYNIMKLGDIAFEGNKSKRFLHGRFVENTIGDGIASHVFVVFHPISAEHDINYWKYAINNENIMRNVLIRCTKSSTMMTDLVVDDFLKETILVPSYAEQQKIGAYFRNLDQQISLQTQRLEKLKQIKATCLDKMFV